jgi:geranylgeranyl pyrophosphate synthase
MNQLVGAVDLLPELQAIDDYILSKLESRSALIKVAGRYLLSGGGKRIRASLAVLAARLGDSYSFEGVLHAATAVELIHAASLVHDDLIDDADQRRGRTTIHTKWNGNVALMVGDYLFALAAGEMALAPDPRVIRIFAEGVQRICEAELSPVTDVQPTDQAVGQYYEKIGGKTAALFESAARAGSICGGGDEGDVEALGQFGYEVGLAYQIVDDVLDFTADAGTLGKPAGHDLYEGTITLPLILGVQAGGSAILHEVVHTDRPSAALVDAAVAEVRRVQGTEYALREARRLIASAQERLDHFEERSARSGLINLAEFALRRAM